MATTKVGFQLASSLASKHLTDAEFIKGGFFVVDTYTNLTATGDNIKFYVANGEQDGTIVEGSLCYCTEDKKFYQYNGLAWEEAKLGGSIIPITYAELVTLRDSSQLVPGQQYRITDYQCTTTQENTSSAGHQFDIIVTADSENTLNENARAILHEGDIYFATNNLSAWELKYCLDNDTTRFRWAATNGKGVIYYMKDEYNNECPYDFKNIQFIRKLTAGKLDKENGIDTWCYTFNGYDENEGGIYDLSVLVSLDFKTDEGGECACQENVISAAYDSSEYRGYDYGNTRFLNDIVFLNIITDYSSRYSDSWYECSFNTFSNNCHSNTFDSDCNSNTFGNYCYSNTFGYGCFSNTFGDSCRSNTFGDYCYSNTFGNSYGSNTFGSSGSSNIFGNDCNSNTFGDSCRSNTFDNSCSHNIFGDRYQYNTFGMRCEYNTFGGDTSNIKIGAGCSKLIFPAYVEYITVDPFIRNITLISNAATSTGSIENIKIDSSCTNYSHSDSYVREITVPRGEHTLITYVGYDSTVIQIDNTGD